MKTLYLECKMGLSGSMLLGALYELLPDQAAFSGELRQLGIRVTANRSESCGIPGTRISVSLASDAHEALLRSDHSAAHSPEQAGSLPFTVADISRIIDRLSIPEPVYANVNAVFTLIAQAVSQIGSSPNRHIVFHDEISALEGITEVVGVCLAMRLLHPDRMIASPVHLGGGQVRRACGILPVPTPLIMRLLSGVPCYCGEYSGELCTPVGAALLSHFVHSFGPMPTMIPEKIGCGIRPDPLPVANCVRAFFGEDGTAQQSPMIELRCNIDDMTAEALAFAGEQLLSQGALDVSTSPLTMKKSRSGICLAVLCKPQDEERIAHAILRETTTNGVRASQCRKYLLRPSSRSVETTFGTVRIKCADNERIHHEKPEYEDVAAIARATGLPFQQVWQEIVRQIAPQAERK